MLLYVDLRTSRVEHKASGSKQGVMDDASEVNQESKDESNIDVADDPVDIWQRVLSVFIFRRNILYAFVVKHKCFKTPI